MGVVGRVQDDHDIAILRLEQGRPHPRVGGHHGPGVEHLLEDHLLAAVGEAEVHHLHRPVDEVVPLAAGVVGRVLGDVEAAAGLGRELEGLLDGRERQVGRAAVVDEEEEGAAEPLKEAHDLENLGGLGHLAAMQLDGQVLRPEHEEELEAAVLLRLQRLVVATQACQGVGVGRHPRHVGEDDVELALGRLDGGTLHDLFVRLLERLVDGIGDAMLCEGIAFAANDAQLVDGRVAEATRGGIEGAVGAGDEVEEQQAAGALPDELAVAVEHPHAVDEGDEGLEAWAVGGEVGDGDLADRRAKVGRGVAVLGPQLRALAGRQPAELAVGDAGHAALVGAHDHLVAAIAVEVGDTQILAVEARQAGLLEEPPPLALRVEGCGEELLRVERHGHPPAVERDAAHAGAAEVARPEHLAVGAECHELVVVAGVHPARWAANRGVAEDGAIHGVVPQRPPVWAEDAERSVNVRRRDGDLGAAVAVEVAVGDVERQAAEVALPDDAAVEGLRAEDAVEVADQQLGLPVAVEIGGVEMVDGPLRRDAADGDAGVGETRAPGVGLPGRISRDEPEGVEPHGASLVEREGDAQPHRALGRAILAAELAPRADAPRGDLVKPSALEHAALGVEGDDGDAGALAELRRAGPASQDVELVWPRGDRLSGCDEMLVAAVLEHGDAARALGVGGRREGAVLLEEGIGLPAGRAVFEGAVGEKTGGLGGQGDVREEEGEEEAKGSAPAPREVKAASSRRTPKLRHRVYWHSAFLLPPQGYGGRAGVSRQMACSMTAARPTRRSVAPTTRQPPRRHPWRVRTWRSG